MSIGIQLTLKRNWDNVTRADCWVKVIVSNSTGRQFIETLRLADLLVELTRMYATNNG